MDRSAVLDRPAASGAAAYARRLSAVLAEHDWASVDRLTEMMRDAWVSGRQVFLCGNGGSAANAVHIANDFVFPVAKLGKGVRVTALTANPAVLTCLANDLSYEQVFSKQLETLAQPGDLLIVLSGSGNSANVLLALDAAREIGMQSVAILGFDGGRCREMADLAVHFHVDDMQIAEDLQLVVGHMVMQALSQGKDAER